MRSTRRFLLALLVILSSSLAMAQQQPNVERGFRPGKLYDYADFGSINLFNGNLNVAIPIGPTFPVGGKLGYSLALHYSGNTWEPHYSSAEYDLDGDGIIEGNETNVDWNWAKPAYANAGMGWELSFGRLYSASSPFATNWAYFSPDGGEHAFYRGLHDNPSGDFNPPVSYTRDGTYIRHTLATLDGVEGSHKLEFPDGIVKEFTPNGTFRRMYDRANNTVEVTYNGSTLPVSSGTTCQSVASTWTISDGHRTHYVYFTNIGSDPIQGQVPIMPSVCEVNLAAFGGQRAVYKLHYSSRIISREAVHTDKPAPSKTVMVPLLRKIDFPDGTSYENVYDIGMKGAVGLDSTNADEPDQTPSLTGGHNPGSFTGHLRRVTTPTKAEFTWDYQTYQFPPKRQPSEPPPFNDKSYRDKSAGVNKVYRSHLDPIAGMVTKTTTYTSTSINHNGGLRGSMTTVDPGVGEAKSRHYFSLCKDCATGGTPQWNNSEYGLPLSRVPSAAGAIAQNPKDGRFLSTQIVAQNDTVLRSVYVAYESDTNSLISPEGEINSRLSSQSAVYHDDSGRSVTTTYSDFDGLGHYRTATTFEDFTGSVTSRTSTTNYNRSDSAVGGSIHDSGVYCAGGCSFNMPPTAGKWILDTYTRQTRSDSTGSATTLYLFDDNGFLTRARTLSGVSAGENDLLTVFTRTSGNVTDEAHYGGDTQSLPFGTLAAMIPTVPQYRIAHTYQYGSLKSSRHFDTKNDQSSFVNFFAVDNEIDSSTGLVRLSRDIVGAQTTYSFDASGRPSESKAMSTSAGVVRSWTRYLYDNATASTGPRIVQQTLTPSGSIDFDSRIEFDGLGREVKTSTQQVLGDSYTTVETRYDSASRKTNVSMPATTASKWTTLTYDELGRTTKVKNPAPDNSEVLFSYTGTRLKSRTSKVATATSQETAVTVTESYDGIGRLRKVEEASGPTRYDPNTASATTAAPVATEYDYDYADRLTRVLMRGSEAGASQERFFTYDARGFLLQEQHPESGATWYKDYDARGHARLKLQGANKPNYIFDLRSTYDSAERLTLVESRNPFWNPNYPSTPGLEEFRPSKKFIFGTSNATMTANRVSYRAGRLWQAIRYNYSPTHNLYPILVSNPLFIVTEQYEYYDDDQGRQTERETTIAQRDGSVGPETVIRRIQQFVDYNHLGRPSKIGYPKCDFCASVPRLPIEPVYTRGRLTKIPGIVDGISYAPNGMLTSVSHANGMTDTYEQDASGMARPRSVKFESWSSCTPPTITSDPQNQTIGAGGYVLLSVGVSGTAPFQYQWYRMLLDGSTDAIAGATQQSYQTPALSETTKYWVRVTNSCRSKDSGVATITINCASPIITQPPQSQTIAAGTTVLLSVAANGSGSLSYEWQRWTGSAWTTVGTNSATYVTPALTTTTSYRVIATSNCGAGSTVTSDTAVLTVPLAAPAGLVATRHSATEALLQWQAVSGASSYRVERRSDGVDFALLASVVPAGTTSFVDGGRAAGKTYVYRVYAEDANGGSRSPYSNHDLATMMTFASTGVGGAIDDAHAQELLTALNAVRQAANWPSVTWANILPAGLPAPAGGVRIYAAHLTSLRARMNEVLQALGISLTPYSNPTLTGAPIRYAHIDELRRRAQ